MGIEPWQFAGEIAHWLPATKGGKGNGTCRLLYSVGSRRFGVVAALPSNTATAGRTPEPCLVGVI